jgi:23S rRNA G2069 N7-methylase RlmK/C1962 C5-methylase RlmI
MRILELFSGTQSVSKAAKNMGCDVISLDMDFRTKPDIVADILHWDYKSYQPGQFDLIWASPPALSTALQRR